MALWSIAPDDDQVGKRRHRDNRIGDVTLVAAEFPLDVLVRQFLARGRFDSLDTFQKLALGGAIAVDPAKAFERGQRVVRHDLQHFEMRIGGARNGKRIF